jgi:uncharacterized membrane protein YbhN (UPF0104 family)
MTLVKKYLRIILSTLILAATICAFAYYVHGHPETLDRLRAMPPGLAGALIVLYLMWFGALVLLTRFSLRAYGKTIGKQENLLFNAYSSLINFFGPGQSGPVFRGIYLKKRHGLGIKQYVFITLISYGFYAVISAFLLFVGNRPWWQTVLVILAAAGGSFVVIRRYKQKHLDGKATLHLPALGWIFAATALQLTIQTTIYGVELHAAGAHPSLGQILSYSGAANFALFAALTPGAIGIREAFLVFSQQLHHIPNTIIVAANIIDRAVYLLFLGALFMMTFLLHAKDKLRVGQLSEKEH